MVPAPSALLLTPQSPLRQQLDAVVAQARVLSLCGIPGVGKTLLLQQTVLLAARAGRVVTTLQWDVARRRYDRPDVLTRFPEVGGTTHAVLRHAAGLWLRPAIAAWATNHTDPAALLVVEAPLIGHRFVDIARPIDDTCEHVLDAPACRCLVPVPTAAVRQTIEQARTRDMAAPADARDVDNAPPHLVRSAMGHLREVAATLGLRPHSSTSHETYDAPLYAAVYAHVLRHRHTAVLPVDEVLPVTGSAYHLDIPHTELVPGPDEVDATLAAAAGVPLEQTERLVAEWYRT